METIGDSFTEGFNRFVTSTVAPVASGWSTCRVGFSPTGKAPPYHGAPRYLPLVTGRRGSIHVYGRRSRRRRAAGGPKRVGDGPAIVSPKRTSVGYGTQPPAWFTVTPYPKCANDGHPRADYSGPLSLR